MQLTLHYCMIHRLPFIILLFDKMSKHIQNKMLRNNKVNTVFLHQRCSFKSRRILFKCSRK